jgi:hypothetical protein
MASQASVQGHVNLGFAILAAKLGAVCEQYRPVGAGNPLAAGNLLGTLPVLFDTNANMQQAQPRKRQNPESWYGAFDATDVLVGDYLVDAALGTFFVSAIDWFRPARMVLCNQVLTFSRPGAQTPGAGDYGGGQGATNTPLLTSWPAALIQGTKGEHGEAQLPGDVRLPWSVILLPASGGVELLTGDWAVTAEVTPRFHTLSSCELTSGGWRFSAALANP